MVLDLCPTAPCLCPTACQTFICCFSLHVNALFIFLLIFHLPTGCCWNMNVCGHHPIDITRRSLGISYEVKTWWQEMIGWVCVCVCLCVGFAWHFPDLNPIYTLLNMWQDACEFLCVCLCVSRTPPVTGECHVWWSLLPYTCSAPAINFADANEPYCITEA